MTDKELKKVLAGIQQIPNESEREPTEEERKLEEIYREQFYNHMANLIYKYGARVLKAQRERKEAQEKGNQA